jgi:hypothetical protein
MDLDCFIEPFRCEECYVNFLCSYENIESMPVSEEFLSRVRAREEEIRRVRQEIERRMFKERAKTLFAEWELMQAGSPPRGVRSTDYPVEVS